MKKIFITDKWIIKRTTEDMVNLHLVDNFKMYFFEGQTPPSFYISYSIFGRVWTHHIVKNNLVLFYKLENFKGFLDLQIKKDYENTIGIIEENIKGYEDMLPEKEETIIKRVKI